MSASWLIVAATFLFSAMGVCVKLASAEYEAGEIVFYRCLTGAVLMLALARWRGGTLATRLPAMHFWRSFSGVVSLCLWFYALGNLPLATAMTLNYMSSVWMALFLIGGAVAAGSSRIDGRLVSTVLVGFAGVALILRPTIEEQQLWHGLMGPISGVIAAVAYLQLTALGRAGEPEYRIVFWFSAGGSTGRTLVNASLQYLGIAWAFLFGVLLFDDRVTALAIFGMLLVVVAGLSATMLRSRAGTASIGDPPNTA